MCGYRFKGNTKKKKKQKRKEEWMCVSKWEAVWMQKFHHSISITHHLIFHTSLAPSLTFHHSIFFTLFVGPIPLTWCSFFFFSVAKLIEPSRKKKEKRTEPRKTQPKKEPSERTEKKKERERTEPKNLMKNKKT